MIRKVLAMVMCVHVTLFAIQNDVTHSYVGKGEDILEALSDALCQSVSSKSKNIGYEIQLVRFSPDQNCSTCSVHIHRKNHFYLVNIYKYKEQKYVKYSGSDIMLDASGEHFSPYSHLGKILEDNGIRIIQQEKTPTALKVELEIQR